MLSLVLLSMLLAFSGCGSQESFADLVLVGGRIVTVSAERPEVEALAVTQHRVAALGSRAEIERWIGPRTQVVDLDGRLAIPGFIEGHGHFLGLGEALTILDLTEASSWDAIVAQVARAAEEAEPGAWIRGRGWHQEKWELPPKPEAEGGPVHGSLSAVSPDNPVLLTHASGHAAFANARALEKAGLDRSSPDPPGGEFVRDAFGDLSGLLRETAQRAAAGAYARSLSGRSPEEVEIELRRRVALAGEEALRNGVTSFQDAGSSFDTIAFYRRLEEQGALPVRLYVMVRPQLDGTVEGAAAELGRRLAEFRTVAVDNDFLTVRGIKRQVDGALGAHGAWLLEPYDDLPRSVGLILEPIEDIRLVAELALEHGYQLNTHAIGDRANREMLDLYEEVLAGSPDRRWRIEHAQHIHPDDVPRFGELGVIASMQGVHATSDGPWVARRLGNERSRTGAYVWRSLLDAGAVVINGTDVPVEDIDPLASFHASVTRVTADGTTFHPEQRMTREEALRSYTIDAAYAAFEEGEKGSLEVGKLADIVVLSGDILGLSDAKLSSVQVHMTILGGEIRYQAE
ncbi:MAG: amidohydrolase [Acidobacteriota bacterium]|nr:amidohydrolase [Acidobacteriota bacterium]